MLDPFVLAVLALFDERYLEPARVDRQAMLAAAEGAAARELPGAEAALALRGGAASGAGLVAGLAPALETVLAAADPARRTTARRALLDACLRTLDPYCRALDGRTRQHSVARFTGVSGGVGVRIGRRAGSIVVLGFRPGSPAAEAGLRAGDAILEVDGAPVDGQVVSTVAGRLQGRPGTTVTLRIDRSPAELRLVRRQLPLDTVRGTVDERGRVGIRITHLSRRTPREVDHWLAETRAADAAGIELDLRGNTGGSMLAAAAIADRFVDRGVLLETLDRHGRPVPGLRSRVEAGPGAIRVPLVVAVDRVTGSSAELLAAALAWHGRAELAGERTRGKNFVQSLHHWDEADLTVRLSAAYLHTAGRRLPASGLVPDRPYLAPGEPCGG
jgi:carboxyl-terminal processing protease